MCTVLVFVILWHPTVASKLQSKLQRRMCECVCECVCVCVCVDKDCRCFVGDQRTWRGWLHMAFVFTLSCIAPIDSTQDRIGGNPGSFQLSSLTNFPVNPGQNMLGGFGGTQPSLGGIGGTHSAFKVLHCYD